MSVWPEPPLRRLPHSRRTVPDERWQVGRVELESALRLHLRLIAPPFKIPLPEHPIQNALRLDLPYLFASAYRDDRFAVPPPKQRPLIYSAGRRAKKAVRFKVTECA